MAGSYHSRNFNGLSSLESFVVVCNDMVANHAIDPGKIWIAGFSEGARAASGNKKQCKKWLTKAIEKGLVYSKRIFTDRALLNIMSTEEINFF